MWFIEIQMWQLYVTHVVSRFIHIAGTASLLAWAIEKVSAVELPLTGPSGGYRWEQSPFQ